MRWLGGGCSPQAARARVGGRGSRAGAGVVGARGGGFGRETSRRGRPAARISRAGARGGARHAAAPLASQEQAPGAPHLGRHVCVPGGVAAVGPPPAVELVAAERNAGYGRDVAAEAQQQVDQDVERHLVRCAQVAPGGVYYRRYGRGVSEGVYRGSVREECFKGNAPCAVVSTSSATSSRSAEVAPAQS